MINEKTKSKGNTAVGNGPESGQKQSPWIVSLLKKLINSNDLSMLLPILVLGVIIGIMNPVFLSFDNLMNVAKATSFTFIVAIGMTFLLICASFDLSVGSFLALGNLVVGMCLVNGLPIWLSLLLTILLGVVGGSLNGFIVIRFGIPPMIATLGMMYMARGIVLILTKGAPIYPLPDSFNMISNGTVLGIPNVAIIAVILAVGADFLLRKTVFGRSVYAVGGNEDTARLSGIPVNKTKLITYIITTALATFTGALVASRLGSSQPNIGEGFEMQVIASVIIGGTSMFGGAGTIVGTALGAIFMNILSNGMTLIRVSAYWQKFVIGLVIIIAVAIDQYKRSRKIY